MLSLFFTNHNNEWYAGAGHLGYNMIKGYMLKNGKHGRYEH